MKCKYFLIIMMIIALCYGGFVVDDSFERDGYTRTFRVFIPQNTDPGASLILFLHQYGGSGVFLYNLNCDFHYWADTGHCYVIYPDALPNDNSIRAWNSGLGEVLKDGNVRFPTPDIDDVGFLSALIDTICQRYQIDTNRIYCTGPSNGGLMSFRLMAEMGDRFAKVAPVATALLYSTAELLETAPSIPLLWIQGTQDQYFPYDGGVDTVYSVPQSIEILRSFNQCTLPPDSVKLPNIDVNDGFTGTVLTHKSDVGCNFFFYRMDGMGHYYPGYSIDFPSPPHGDINATEQIWEFFMNDSFEVKSHIWADSSELGPSLYMNPHSDSLHITCSFYNKYDHNFNAYAILENSQGNVVDSFELFDDGIRDDGITDNNIWGTYIGTQTNEDLYVVHVRSHDAENGEKYTMEDQARFTTAGPIVYCDSVCFTYGEFLPGNNCKYRLVMQNMGAEYTLEDLDITVSSEDTQVDLVNALTRSIPDLAPGESALVEGDLYLKVSDDCPLGHELNIDISITCGGIEYWKDMAQLYVNVIDVPNTCLLDQNYPNPFNPLTKINYELSVDSQVELTIYDITGRKIATLINEYQPSGYYMVNWDASGNSSGIYVYRLKVGDFIETKKMVLMK